MINSKTPDAWVLNNLSKNYLKKNISKTAVAGIPWLLSQPITLYWHRPNQQASSAQRGGPTYDILRRSHMLYWLSYPHPREQQQGQNNHKIKENRMIPSLKATLQTWEFSTRKEQKKYKLSMSASYILSHGHSLWTWAAVSASECPDSSSSSMQ